MHFQAGSLCLPPALVVYMRQFTVLNYVECWDMLCLVCIRDCFLVLSYFSSCCMCCVHICIMQQQQQPARSACRLAAPMSHSEPEFTMDVLTQRDALQEHELHTLASACLACHADVHIEQARLTHLQASLQKGYCALCNYHARAHSSLKTRTCSAQLNSADSYRL